eukprot:TRINITY_DN37150_c0_g1_i4.p1 TRINITY_DN37150_c0_g1~~TRINITY_DN37150_c0_g1_i4.p1  ORF type:complete len:146 (-),score=33.01 TRINITY_DN37150_c0_g1_i4:143-580(-)
MGAAMCASDCSSTMVKSCGHEELRIPAAVVSCPTTSVEYDPNAFEELVVRARGINAANHSLMGGFRDGGEQQSLLHDTRTAELRRLEANRLKLLEAESVRWEPKIVDDKPARPQQQAQPVVGHGDRGAPIDWEKRLEEVWEQETA